MRVCDVKGSAELPEAPKSFPSAAFEGRDFDARFENELSLTFSLSLSLSLSLSVSLSRYRAIFTDAFAKQTYATN